MKLSRLLIILLAIKAAVFAYIGKIVTTNAEVSIVRDSKTIKAQSGQTIEQKDTIKTLKGGVAQIEFNDKTYITVGASSVFSVEEYLYDNKAPNARFKAEKGYFKVVTGQIGKIAPDKFKVETKTATLGIRGTEFKGFVDELGNLTTLTTRGKTVLTSTIPNVTSKTTEIPAGYMSKATQKGVEVSVPFSADQLKNMNTGFSGQVSPANEQEKTKSKDTTSTTSSTSNSSSTETKSQDSASNASTITTSSETTSSTTSSIASGTMTVVSSTTTIGSVVNDLSSDAIDSSANNATYQQVVSATSVSVPTITSVTASSNSATISGTAEPGSTVKIYNGGTLIATVTADAVTGAFSYTATLSDGTYTLTASATDAAGNISQLSSVTTLNIDTVSPNIPTITSVTASSNSATISGTAEPGSTVKIYNGGTLIATVTADAVTGAFSYTATLSDGTYTLTASATDAAGNISQLSSVTTLNIDTVSPNIPTITSVTASSNNATVSGTAEPGSTVKIYNGGTLIATVTADAVTGVFSYTYTTVLSDGTYTLTASATDAAGNISQLSSVTTLNIDTTSPNIPTITSVTASSNNHPTISGTAEPGSTVKIYNGGTLIATVTADAVTGAFSYNATLSDGTYTLTASATDAAGNISQLSSVTTLNIDTTSPNTPTITSVTASSNNHPTISGTAEPGSTVKIYNGGTLIATVTADAVTGAFSYTYTTVLNDGTYTLTASATDAAGNISQLSSVTTMKIDVGGYNFYTDYQTKAASLTSSLSSATTYSVPTVSGSATTQMGSLVSNKGGFGLATLQDGSILAIGGVFSSVYFTDVQKYDPVSNTWTVMSSSLNTARGSLAAATLQDGRVLAIGGYLNGSYLGTVEIYDPTLDVWTYTGSLNTARVVAGATTLQDGSVLLIGGVSLGAISSVEKYNPSTGTWSTVASISTGRYGLKAVTLQDGSALAIGGTNGTLYYNTVQKYNPTTNTWSTMASLGTGRTDLAAIVLQDGSVLAIGGRNGTSSYLSSVEKYTPSLNVWQYLISLPFTWYGGNAAMLPNGNILLVGGAASGVNTYQYNYGYTNTSYTSLPYHSGINNGYFVGYENSNMSGNRVSGGINSMIFSQEGVASGLGLTTNSGELNGALSTSLSSVVSGLNSSTTTMDFVQYDGTNQTASYTSSSDKLILGQVSIKYNGNTSVGTIGFQTLPDTVDATGNLSTTNQYVSWGYWEAKADATANNPALEYHGWWTSGTPTDASVVKQLITNSANYSYSGHVLGDTYNASGSIDPILLNSNNSLNMSINFANANPVSVTKMSFDTQQGWSYSQSSNLTAQSSSISTNLSTNTQSFAASVGNSVNTADVLKLQGKFYGSSANAVGGAFAGSLTGADAAQRAVQGVFNAKR